MNRIILYIIFIFSFSKIYSQEIPNSINKDARVIIKMYNGDEYKGKIIDKDDEYIVLETVNGEIKLIFSNVKEIENYDYKGEFQFPNPHDTRYFFGPSGIPMKKGKGYYQNVLLTTNFVNYGIAKNVSIGGGLEFISTVLGSPIWFLTPKVGFDLSNNVHIGGGFIMAGFANEGNATLGYGVFTLGDPETNLSLGLGYGFIDGDLSDYPSIMIAGTHRLTNGISLLSENYVFPNGNGNASYFGIQGLRILSKKSSFDFGAIIIPAIIDFIPAFPFIGFARVF